MNKLKASNKQLLKFSVAAKEYGCNKSEKVFEEKLKKIATANLSNEKKKQKN